MRFLEPLARGFRENRGSERPKDFAVFNALVQYLFHFRTSRVSDDTPVPQRPRPPFRAALEPPKNFPIRHNCGGAFAQIILGQFIYPPAILSKTACIDRAPSLIPRVTRPPVSVIHDERARLSENLMPHKERSSNSQ